MNLIGESKPVFLTASIFSILALVFTVISLTVSSPEDQVGIARPLSAIPIHEVELGAMGVLLGLLALGIYGRGGIAVALLLPALVILLDLDHLPSFLGIAQPIRPAHSLVFLTIDVAMTTIILRRVEFGLVAMSAFTGHLGVDTGLVPRFSPISFTYSQLDPYSIPLITSSIALAFAAGYLMRRRNELLK